MKLTEHMTLMNISLLFDNLIFRYEFHGLDRCAKNPYEFKDTEAAVSDLEVPEVDAEVVCRQVSLIVTVD